MLFFYNYNGDNMKIYLDLILILNFFLDFILLISVGLILKRKINIKLITIGSFIGSLSILLLFMNINSLELFIIKIFISFIMILISYPNGNIKYILYNQLVLYITSFFLGGILYLINIELNYKHTGLIFINNGLSINFIFMIILSPIIIYFYIKEQRLIRNKYNNYYSVNILINKLNISCTGYIDSGNNLTFKNNPVILVNRNIINNLDIEYRVIPYKVVNNIMMLKIYKCNMVIINNHVFNNIYIGLSNETFNIDGVDVLLNNKLMEEL